MCGDVVNIRRVLLDVDKALGIPSILEIAEAIEGVAGVEGANITVTEIDAETVGMEITVEGDQIDFAALERAIVRAGAALHSVDELVVGSRTVERVPRSR
ncbi:MAG TPA: DUF211 domain-containing protein [Acidimicrobiales bacterium]|nr:DUF211 domain-containing protein [Acidimicrobiales bacterium]